LVEIVKYDYRYLSYNLDLEILENLSLSPNIEEARRERIFIKDICKKVKKSKTVLYTLKNDTIIIGLVAISVTSSINEQPSMQIDYIFIDSDYRGKNLEILENTKPFRYLIEFVIDVAKRLQSEVGLRYIVLSPDNDDLKEKYNNLSFQKLAKSIEWMYLKI
jgi:GNAT superfamily N-acetyltransferase